MTSDTSGIVGLTLSPYDENVMTFHFPFPANAGSISDDELTIDGGYQSYPLLGLISPTSADVTLGAGLGTYVNVGGVAHCECLP
jgi:hypothetical protein